MKRILSFTILLLIGIALKAQNDATGYSEELVEKAAKNDRDAMFLLSKCYYDGNGVEKDVYKAFEYAVMAKINNTIGAGKLRDTILDSVFKGDSATIKKVITDAEKGNMDAGFMYAFHLSKNDGMDTANLLLLQNARNGHELSAIYYIVNKFDETMPQENATIIKPLFDFLVSRNNVIGYVLKAAYTMSLSQTAENMKQAENYLITAAEMNSLPAMHILSNLYIDNIFGEKNYEKAFYWIQRASDAEYEPAMVYMAKFYYEGIGCEQSIDKYIECLRKACDAGSDEACYLLANEYVNGDNVEVDFSKALELYLLAAERGYSRAYEMIGDFYYKGIGTEENTCKAVEYYLLAAEEPNAEVMNRLGAIYYIGDCVEADFDKALEWWEKAGELGHPVANYDLALCYLNHEGGLTDTEKGIMYLRRSASVDHAPAMARLAEMYYTGNGLSVDLEQGFKLAVKAARKLDTKALQILAQVYDKGIGVDSDKKRSLMLNKAYEAMNKDNNEKAMELMERALEGIEE